MTEAKNRSDTQEGTLSRRLTLMAIILAVSPSVFFNGCAKHEPATNSPLWSITLSRAYVYGEHSGILQSNGVLYCVTTDDPDRCDQAATLYAIESSTGAIVWRSEIETDCFSSTSHPFLISTLDFLCYKSKDKSLRAIDSHTGKELIAETGVRSVLDLLGAQIHVLDNDWNYAIIDISSRKRTIRSQTKGNENTQLTHIGGVLFLFNHSELSATDSVSGRLLWSRKFGPRSRVSADEHSKRLYVFADKKLSVLDSETGRLIWERDDLAAPPAVVQDKIYIPIETYNSPSRVQTLDSGTGAETGSAFLPLWNGLAVLSDGIAWSYSKKPHYRDIEVARRSFAPEQAASADYRIEASDMLTGGRLWFGDWIWGEYLTKVIVSGNVACVGIAKTDWNGPATLRGYRITNPRQ